MFDNSIAKAERFVTTNEWRLLHARLRSKLRYQSLSRAHRDPIRLFLLYPKSAGDAIHGKFIGTGLTDPPPYIALSYTWGNPYANPFAVADHVDLNCKSTKQSYEWYGNERRHTIFVNGRTFEIGQNLFDALYNIRDARKKILVWVDALCINQEDDNEKRHQVSIMNHIYRNATRVHVWLGPQEPSRKPDATKSGVRLDLVSEDPSFMSRPELFCLIATSSWFQRLWIVQEVSVASDIVFLYGDIDIELWELDAFFRSENTDLDRFGYKSDVDQEIMRRAKKVFRRIAAIREIMDNVRLEVIVYAWRFNLCGDPRDKVYGLLSLAQKADSRLLLEPDYKVSLADLSKNLVLASIRAYETLDVLRYVDNFSNDSFNPSWACKLDIDTRERSKFTNNVTESNITNAICALEPASKHQQRPLPTNVELEGASILKLSGRVVLVVSTVGDTVYDYHRNYLLNCDPNKGYQFKARTGLSDDDARKFEASLPSSTRPLPSLLAVPTDLTGITLSGNTTQPLVDQFTELLILGNGSPTSESQLRQAYSQRSLTWDWSFPRFEDFPNAHAAVFERSTNDRYPSEMYSNRRLAMTDRAVHAIVPRHTQPGDYIVMLSHSRNPFVIRPKLKNIELTKDKNVSDSGNESISTENGLDSDGENELHHEIHKRDVPESTIGRGNSSSANMGEPDGDAPANGEKDIGHNGKGEVKDVIGERGYTFVGACYLERRLDWDLFERLEMAELEEFWLY